jgi:hypothetical protein
MIKLKLANPQTDDVKGKSRRYKFVSEYKYREYLRILKVIFKSK